MLAAQRIRFLTIGCVVITALAIGAIAFNGFRTLLRDQRAEGLQTLVLDDEHRITLALHELWNDVRLVATLPAVDTVASLDAPTEDAAAARGRVARYFEEMIRAKAAYAQVRLIGARDGGREVVRVNRVDGAPHRVPDDRLQRKAGQDYFMGAMQSAPGELYVSAITLNREHGEVEVPHRPMLRAAVRVLDRRGEPFGIVIINLDFDRLLSDLGIGPSDEQPVYMTNEAGDYLLHPDAGKRFGFDLGHRFRLQDDAPDLAPLLDDPDTDALTIDRPDRDRLMHFRRVFPFPDDSDRFVVLGQEASSETLAFGAKEVTERATLATAALAVLMFVAALWVGRVQTRPLEQITAAVQALGRGEEVQDLPVGRSDELGALARAFRQMVSDLQANEAALREANERLAAANDDLEHFVHIAAHDLREPLRKLRKLVALLEDDLTSGDEEDVTRLLQYIVGCSTQMQAMIDAFRELTKVGTMNLVRERVALRPLIDEVLDGFADRLKARAVKVEVDALPDAISAYRPLLRVLYTNLVGNALEHVSEDGFTLRFTAEKTDGRWRLGVLNTGSTISASEAREVFKLFRKGDADATHGTGVGLSVCKKIVERHRGRIDIQTGPDSFHVRFELQTHDPEAAKRQ